MTNMIKRKDGENEAIEILQNLGESFNLEHSDSGEDESKPDLQYSNGRFLEVTHTRHNNLKIQEGNHEYDGKTIEEILQIQIDISNAQDRLNKDDYEIDENGELTQNGLQQFRKDYKLVHGHYGYIDEYGELSEFDCISPIFTFSVDHITRMISKKSKKHDGKDIDLFIFITEDEFSLLKSMILERRHSGFINLCIKSVFKTIYLCVWDIYNNTYELKNPTMIKIWKDETKIYIKELKEDSKSD